MVSDSLSLTIMEVVLAKRKLSECQRSKTVRGSLGVVGGGESLSVLNVIKFNHFAPVDEGLLEKSVQLNFLRKDQEYC